MKILRVEQISMENDLCRLDIRSDGPVTVARLTGKVTIRDLSALQEQVRDLLARTAGRGVVLDFEGIEMIDSALLGFLMSIHKALLQHGRALALARLSALCHDTLRISGLNRILAIHETPEAARESLEG